MENDDTIRIIVIDVTKPLGANVYDEVILPVCEATIFAEKYIDMTKYRIVTI